MRGNSRTFLAVAFLGLLTPALASAFGSVRAAMVSHFVIATVPVADMPQCATPCVTPAFMTLDTEPWTKVVIDGEVKGSTPLFKMRLLPGAHSIQFINEREELNQTESFNVTGGQLARVRGQFVREGEPQNELVGTGAATDGDGCGTCAADLLTPSFLTVDSKPWGRVYVDGQRVGITPLFKFKVAPGVHTVRVVNDETGVASSRRLNAREGAVTKFKFDLTDEEFAPLPVAAR